MRTTSNAEQSFLRSLAACPGQSVLSDAACVTIVCSARGSTQLSSMHAVNCKSDARMSIQPVSK